MENLDFASDLNNRSFPALREITGYLLFYRVFGLRSIGQLFPNLAVIRGQQLLFDFSFVVYELMQLQVRSFSLVNLGFLVDMSCRFLCFNICVIL
jgi:insulin receptor